MAPEISVVVPMRNESPNVAGLYRELTAALSGFGRPYEIIAIDDGSTDDTFDQAGRYAPGQPQVRVHRLPRHLGKGGAVRAAIPLAHADSVQEIAVDDPGVLADVDTALDLARARKFQAIVDLLRKYGAEK